MIVTHSSFVLPFSSPSPSPSHSSVVGLVRSYVSLGKTKEALTFAKEARKLMPQSPHSITLMGVVLTNTPYVAVRKKVTLLEIQELFFFAKRHYPYLVHVNVHGIGTTML